jgi:hypothetical protein
MDRKDQRPARAPETRQNAPQRGERPSVKPIPQKIGDWSPDDKRCFYCRAKEGDTIHRSKASGIHYLIEQADGRLKHFPGGETYGSLVHAGRKLYLPPEKIELIEQDGQGWYFCHRCNERVLEQRAKNRLKRADRKKSTRPAYGVNGKKRIEVGEGQLSWIQEDDDG